MPDRVGHGPVGAETKVTAGVPGEAVTPGRGGAAPISADSFAGLDARAEGLAAAVVPDAALCVADWQAGLGVVADPAAECPAGGTAHGRCPQAGGCAGAACEAARGTVLVGPSRPEAGLCDSMLELACTRACRSGPTDTVSVAQIASAIPASAGVSRRTGTQAGREKRVRRPGREGQPR